MTVKTVSLLEPSRIVPTPLKGLCASFCSALSRYAPATWTWPSFPWEIQTRMYTDGSSWEPEKSNGQIRGGKLARDPKNGSFVRYLGQRLKWSPSLYFYILIRVRKLTSVLTQNMPFQLCMHMAQFGKRGLLTSEKRNQTCPSCFETSRPSAQAKGCGNQALPGTSEVWLVSETKLTKLLKWPPGQILFWLWLRSRVHSWPNLARNAHLRTLKGHKNRGLIPPI